MSREKIDEIAELSNDIYSSFQNITLRDSRDLAESLYNEGYRKQSEGEWVIKGVCIKIMECSACGIMADSIYAKTRFCPNRGARMKGGE